MNEKDLVLKELKAIKKLLILFSIKSGATTEEIGTALGVDSSRISQMVPVRKIKKKQLERQMKNEKSGEKQ